MRWICQLSSGDRCFPVRLLPYLTNWAPLSPDNLAQLFAGSRPFHKWSIRSVRLIANDSYPPMRSKSWVDIAIDLDELQLELECQPHPVWCQRAVEALPAVLFVLLVDLKNEIGGPNAVAQTAAAPPLANPQHTSSRRKDGVFGTLTHDWQLLPPSPSSLAREWQLCHPHPVAPPSACVSRSTSACSSLSFIVSSWLFPVSSSPMPHASRSSVCVRDMASANCGTPGPSGRRAWPAPCSCTWAATAWAAASHTQSGAGPFDQCCQAVAVQGDARELGLEGGAYLAAAPGLNPMLPCRPWRAPLYKFGGQQPSGRRRLVDCTLLPRRSTASCAVIGRAGV